MHLLALYHYALLSAGLALFGLACLQDWAMRLVPNRVPAAIAVIGLALRLGDGTALAGVLMAAAVFGGAFFCWRRGWLGGADVKLLGAGALLAPPGGGRQLRARNVPRRRRVGSGLRRIVTHRAAAVAGSSGDLSAPLHSA